MPRRLAESGDEPQKFRIYLAGPISGCDPAQVHGWRHEVKQEYSEFLDFIDPAKSVLDQKTPYEVVEAGLDAIEDADGLLVNMWRESIGTAIGVVHANRAGRPVVVADPNHLDNQTLAFYADAVTVTPLSAAKVLLELLRAEANWSVLKSTEESTEPFDRRKLTAAIRAACRDAGRDGIVVPRLVLQPVIDRLAQAKKQLFTTSEIDEVVTIVFARLEADPTHESAVKGISEEWERHREEKHSTPMPPKPSSGVSQCGVEISSGGKSHSTIWGKTVKSFKDIRSPEARDVFNIIRQIPGITRITLGPRTKEFRSACGATVSESTTSCAIDGNLFDPAGRKGTMQSFRVWVQFDSDKERVCTNIIAKLKETNYWAG